MAKKTTKATASAPPKSKYVKIADRLPVIEQSLVQEGWSPAIERRLAKELGVAPQTIRSDKAKVLTSLAEAAASANQDEDRALFAAALQEHIRQAAAAGSWTAVSSMMGLRMRSAGLDKHSGDVDINVTIVVPQKV